jgi:hypothetical protein
MIFFDNCIGIHTEPPSVTPSKSSNTTTVGEPSDGVKSTAPKFKVRPNPIRLKKRMKSDYEIVREHQKMKLERKRQQREDEALKEKEAND